MGMELQQQQLAEAHQGGCDDFDPVLNDQGPLAANKCPARELQDTLRYCPQRLATIDRV